MRLNIILTILLSLLFLPAFSFAFTREEIINNTLNRIELAQSSNIHMQDAYFKENSNPEQYPAEKENRPEQENDLLKGNFYISGDYDINHIHYEETADGNVLDKDYGKETGFYVAVGFKSNANIQAIMGKPYIEAYFRRYDDLITYDGAATDGVNTYPFKYKQKSKVERFGVKVGARANFTQKGEIRGYFDLGRRNWFRGESETLDEPFGLVASYRELYWWTYFGFGLGIDYRFLPKLSCGLELEYMPTFKAEMRADNWFLDPPTTTTFKLKNVYGIELKAPIKYYLLKNLSLDVTPYFTYWKIKHSDPVLVSGDYYYEPDSTTHIEGVFAGFTYCF